jgi:thiamine pyrophosphate-dependent acetolactate synthase large subunit-like protein
MGDKAMGNKEQGIRDIGPINRLEATRYLVGQTPHALIVAGPGNTKFDLVATGDRPQHFYIWNSMGLASSIGLGLALAQPEQQIVVLDGDGSTLMNPGSLVTIARLAPPNLLYIVWDNGQYQLTGGQPTATATVTNLAAMGRGAGFKHVAAVVTMNEFEAGLETWLTETGPWLVVAKIDDSPAPDRPPKDTVWIKLRFMDMVRRKQ